MRATVGIELPQASIEKYAKTATLPFKVAQFFVSLAACLSPIIKPHERMAHGIQGTLSLIQCFLLACILFEKANCDITPSNLTLCTVYEFIDLLYQGTLMVWVPAELNKSESYNEDAENQSSNPSHDVENQGSPRHMMRASSRPETPTPSSQTLYPTPPESTIRRRSPPQESKRQSSPPKAVLSREMLSSFLNLHGDHLAYTSLQQLEPLQTNADSRQDTPETSIQLGLEVYTPPS